MSNHGVNGRTGSTKWWGGKARFNDARFAGEAWFNGVEFVRNASFDKANRPKWCRPRCCGCRRRGSPAPSIQAHEQCAGGYR